MARSEWVKAIQKSIFHAKMDEDNVKVRQDIKSNTCKCLDEATRSHLAHRALSTHPPSKISIPLANVMVVELNTTSFTDTIRLEIKDMDDIEDEV